MKTDKIINSLEAHANLIDGVDEPIMGYKHRIRMAAAIRDAVALLKTHPEVQPNDPLTRKQLRFMSGDPVWIVREDGADRWALIRYCTTGGIHTYGCGYLTWEDLCKTWFPYRRPPKEDR